MVEWGGHHGGWGGFGPPSYIVKKCPDNPHTNKKTESDARYKKPLNRREDASLTALSNAKQVQIWVQTERSSMLIRLAYILFKYGRFKMYFN